MDDYSDLAKPAPIPNANRARHPERVVEDRLYQYGRYIGVERISRVSLPGSGCPKRLA
jgi:hypothetical protein